MAALFVLALLLILWQAWRTRPAPAVGFTMVNEPGEQIFPVAAPSWREPPVLPADRRERLLFLERRSVGLAGAPGTCRMFLRVSAHHWLQRPVAGPDMKDGSVWHLPPEALLDDDDGDGDLLDPGELSRAGPGAEAEVFCG